MLEENLSTCSTHRTTIEKVANAVIPNAPLGQGFGARGDKGDVFVIDLLLLYRKLSIAIYRLDLTPDGHFGDSEFAGNYQVLVMHSDPDNDR
jgi:hypothetical protein